MDQTRRPGRVASDRLDRPGGETATPAPRGAQCGAMRPRAHPPAGHDAEIALGIVVVVPGAGLCAWTRRGTPTPPATPNPPVQSSGPA